MMLTLLCEGQRATVLQLPVTEGERAAKATVSPPAESIVTG